MGVPENSTGHLESRSLTRASSYHRWPQPSPTANTRPAPLSCSQTPLLPHPGVYLPLIHFFHAPWSLPPTNILTMPPGPYIIGHRCPLGPGEGLTQKEIEMQENTASDQPLETWGHRPNSHRDQSRVKSPMKRILLMFNSENFLISPSSSWLILESIRISSRVNWFTTMMVF